MFWVYGIYNKKHDKIYIGQTEDLDRRLKEHNNPNSDVHTYTKNFDGEWVLLYKEKVSSRKQSLFREKQLKSYQGRLFIKQYIPR